MTLFMNRAGRGFSEVGNILNVDFEDDARAVATVDWDRDGDLDMWVANRSAPQPLEPASAPQQTEGV